MSKSPKRVRQIADLIRHQVAYSLKKEVNDPRLAQVSIISVKVSADLGNADIYFALPDIEQLTEVQKAFAKATGYLRHILADRLALRYVPKIHFVYDAAIDQGTKVCELIELALTDDARIKKLNNDDSL